MPNRPAMDQLWTPLLTHYQNGCPGHGHRCGARLAERLLERSSSDGDNLLKTGAFLGPMIALLCSFGMAVAALTFYGDRVVERTSQSRVKTAALALSGQAFDSSGDVYRQWRQIRSIQGRPGPEPSVSPHARLSKGFSGQRGILWKRKYLKPTGRPGCVSRRCTGVDSRWTDSCHAPFGSANGRHCCSTRGASGFWHVYGVLFVGLLLSGFIWFIGLRAVHLWGDGRIQSWVGAR